MPESSDARGPTSSVAPARLSGDNYYPPRGRVEAVDELTATFEIDSKTDAYAVERLMDRLYDSLREESRSIRDGSNDSTEMLERFEMIRDAAQQHRPGRLKVTYEHADEGFRE